MRAFATVTILAGALCIGIGVAKINRVTFGPDVCPYGAAKVRDHYVCLSVGDLEVLAERCYLSEECETPLEHRAHGFGKCALERPWGFPVTEQEGQ